MCGLTGFWQLDGGNADALRAQVRDMARRLTHRGPDDEGEWVDAAAGVAFGFRRLAILDLSPAGHQPMVSADGRFVIVYNGEAYNFRELRAELARDGATFRGSSDTEVILALLSRVGVVETLRRVWGMFAMAIWEVEARTLWLTRDRLGKKPLYYGQAGRCWFFGSELEALRAHPTCPSRIDRGAVAALLRYACIPAPATIYAGVSKLPPGSYARITAAGSIEIGAYWRAADVAAQGVASRRLPPEPQALDELESLLRDAVGRRMIADVPLGAFLSGGIDSSTVVALMQAQSTRPVRTFTIGFADADYDESAAAAAVARHLGTDHTAVRVTDDDAREVVPRLARLYDEPFADSSQIPTVLVSRLARSAVTVSLSGDGGDEVFAGYTRHVWADRVWRQVAPLPAAARRAAAATIERVAPAAWDSLYRVSQGLLPSHLKQRRPGEKLRKLARLLSARDVDAIYPTLISVWDAPAQVVLGAEESATWAQEQTARLELPSLAERMMLSDLVGYLPDDILTKVDRASMSVGLEVRAPLLDHRVVEWAWRLPLSLKLRDGEGKWLLRQVLDRHVPRSLIDRPKTGFALPLGAWLRGPLRGWAETLLDRGRLEQEGFFHPGAIQAVWRSHVDGARDEAHRLWPVLMFQAWLDDRHR